MVEEQEARVSPQQPPPLQLQPTKGSRAEEQLRLPMMKVGAEEPS